MVDTDVQIPSSFDPFAEADEVSNARRDYVHIRIQQRNGRKCVTTIQGLGRDLSYHKILKDIKKAFCCNGNVVEDKSLGKVIQLQGDQRMNVMNFLVKAKLVDKEGLRFMVSKLCW